MTNMENNFLSLVVVHRQQEVLHSTKISGSKTLIWVELRIYSKNFSEEKIHFQIYFKIMMTSLAEEVVLHNFNKAVSEEDWAEERVACFNKAVLEEWVEVNQWARKLSYRMADKKQLPRERESTITVILFVKLLKSIKIHQLDRLLEISIFLIDFSFYVFYSFETMIGKLKIFYIWIFVI